MNNTFNNTVTANESSTQPALRRAVRSRLTKYSFVAIALLASIKFVQPTVLAKESPVPLKNVGMEEGDTTPAAWTKGAPVAGVEQTWDRTTAHGGKASLCLKKTAQRYFPIAQWSQSVTVKPSGTARKLRVRCWVKAQNVTKAILDVTYQAQQPGHKWAAYIGQKQDSDPVATHDWKLYEATVELPAQVRKRSPKSRGSSENASLTN